MNGPLPKSENWAVCPDGVLVRISKGLKLRRQNRNQRRLLVAAGFMVLFIAMGTYFAGRLLPSNMAAPGGVTCDEVQQVLPQYLAGMLPEEQAEKIRQHLAECPMCQEVMKSMTPQTAKDEPSSIFVAKF